MTDAPLDAATLRAALYEARKQRAQLRDARGVLADSVHLILAAEGDPSLDVVMLRFPDSPYEGPPGQPRYRTVSDLRQHLEAIVSHPPIPTPAEGGPPGPRSWRAMVFAHAVPGAGAELVVEVLSDPTDPTRRHWTWARQPLDGIAQPLATDLDDDGFRAAFGAPLTLASVWSSVLRGAAEGRRETIEIERGYQLFAHPRADEVRTVDPPTATVRELRIGVPDEAGLWLLAPGVAQWAPEYARALASGELVGGAVVDRTIAREHLVAALATLGIDAQVHRTLGGSLARRGEAYWPLDLDVLLGAAVHLGRLFTETAVSFAAGVAKNLDRIDRWLAAARRARPAAKWVVTGTHVEVTRADGSWGAKLDLTDVVQHAPPESAAFDAELRFAADTPPEGVDTTRRCGCGAPARMEARLVTAHVLDEMRVRVNVGRVPFLAAWPAAAPRAAVAPLVRCAQHARWATEAELGRWTGGGPALIARLADDLRDTVFRAVASARVTSEGGGRILIAQGEGVASAALSDGALVALNRACGGALTCAVATVVAVLPDAVCLFDDAVDPALVARVVDRLRATNDEITRTPTLRWTVDLTVAPAGAWALRYPTESTPAPSIQRGAPTMD